jgi:hypothetical protein
VQEIRVRASAYLGLASLAKRFLVFVYGKSGLSCRSSKTGSSLSGSIARSSKIVENAQLSPSLPHAERINRNLLASIKS